MCHKDTFTSFGIVVDADVDRTNSTSRSLEYALIATNRYSSVHGEWNTESMRRVCHGAGGSGVI